MPIPAPTDKTTVDVREGGATVKVPAGMVLVPAGKFIFGEGAAAREIELAVFCIGRSATNGAERGKQVNEVRGGSWYFTGRSGMSLGTGEGRARSGGYHSVGFRVVMTPPPAPDR